MNEITTVVKGRVRRTKEYHKYMRDLGLLLPPAGKEIDLTGDLRLILEFGLSNPAADSGNYEKPVQDAISYKWGFNDRQIFENVTRKRIVPRGAEYLRFKIENLPQNYWLNW